MQYYDSYSVVAGFILDNAMPLTPKEKHARRQARRNVLHQAKEDREFAEEYARTWPTVPYFHGQTSPVDFSTPAMSKLREKVVGKSRPSKRVSVSGPNPLVAAMLAIGLRRASTATRPVKQEADTTPATQGQ